MLGDGLVGIRARGSWRVQVQVILKDFQVHLLEPRLEKPRLPEPGQMVGAVRAREILYSRVLCVGGIGPECRRWAKTELLSRSQHPGLPRAGQRTYWAVAAPHARRRRIGAAEGLS